MVERGARLLTITKRCRKRCCGVGWCSKRRNDELTLLSTCESHCYDAAAAAHTVEQKELGREKARPKKVLSKLQVCVHVLKH